MLPSALVLLVATRKEVGSRKRASIAAWVRDLLDMIRWRSRGGKAPASMGSYSLAWNDITTTHLYPEPWQTTPWQTRTLGYQSIHSCSCAELINKKDRRLWTVCIGPCASSATLGECRQYRIINKLAHAVHGTEAAPLFSWGPLGRSTDESGTNIPISNPV